MKTVGRNFDHAGSHCNRDSARDSTKLQLTVIVAPSFWQSIDESLAAERSQCLVYSDVQPQLFLLFGADIQYKLTDIFKCQFSANRTLKLVEQPACFIAVEIH